jgi:hypothetical protein
MKKICRDCGQAKQLNINAKPQSKASGFYGMRCWSCNLQVKKAAMLAYRATDEGLARTSMSKALWDVKNLGGHNATKAKYELKQQTPPWADLDKIREFYELAALSDLTVDHIIPLCGYIVSGLHVHTNLQLLTKSENCAKGRSLQGV